MFGLVKHHHKKKVGGYLMANIEEEYDCILDDHRLNEPMLVRRLWLGPEGVSD